MKIRNLFFQLGMIAILFLGVAAASENPGGKAGKTGSPGEGDCTDCHSSYALNSGSGSVVISSSNLTNWEYVPGNTYSITVTVSHSGRSAFGIGFEALKSNGANAGTLTAGTGTHAASATVSGNSRTNIVQSSGGGTGTTGSHTFNFTWTAPATDVGAVTFYCVGMAANSTTGNSNEASDYVYSTSQVVQPFVAQVQGCTDQSACNYDPAANINVGCVYPQQYYDCSGNCLVDVDNDGLCDQFEILGCTDASACNYNANAGLNDNSCYFPNQSCNDQNPNTVGDTWDNSCTCLGLDSTTQCVGFNVQSTVNQLVCSGDNIGSVALTSNAPGLTYTWGNGSTASSISGLAPGDYYVVISDGVCQENKGFTIQSLNPIAFTSQVTNVSCNGGNDGMVMIQPTGGVAPYSVAGDAMMNLAAGNYNWIITDALGCTHSATATVVEPAAMNVSVGGLATVTANSSHFYSTPTIAGATYVWSASGATITSGQGTASCVFQFGNDAVATLMLTVTNGAGCSMSDTLVVDVTGTLGVSELQNTNAFIFPNPASSEIVISSTQAENQTIEIYNVSGELIYKNNLNGKMVLSVVDWPAGYYSVRWSVNGKKIQTQRFIKENR